MKYLLLGLVLIAGLAGQQPAEPAPASRLYAFARYETTAAGVTTRIEIYVHQHPASSAVGLSIEQTGRTCAAGVCTEAPVISGYALQNIEQQDITIRAALDRADLHTVIVFHDDVTNADLPIQVDVIWTGTGLAHCDDALGVPECDRFATAVVELRRGTRYFVAGVTGPDGILQRQPDRALSSSLTPLSGRAH